ncbi:hypothetical protein GS485_11295 [Rhodococcus hoagii]|nr:hypothetical protein [Prescottella equi]
MIVVRHGTQKPARVLVRFVDESFEGREEWVPPARLKVVWADVDEYRDREARWVAIREAGTDRDDPKLQAAESAIEILLEDEGVEMGYGESGSIRISDPSRLAAATGLDLDSLVGHPLCFVDDAVTVAPWEIAELIARTAVRHDPVPVLEYIESEERRARYEAIHGRWRGPVRGPRDYMEPQRCVEFDETYRKPERETLRKWCGGEAGERFDELLELRKEIRRVGAVAQDAINALVAVGAKGVAADLQRSLGQMVEMLRIENASD